MPDPSEDAFALTPSSPMVTTVDARPQPTDDKSQERLDALYGQRDRVIERAERSMADESRIREEKASALGPVRQRMADIAAQPLPQPPQMEKPPATPKRSDQHDDETWLMASGLLGALAGAFTRRHQTNALAAFTGAMEGYNEGSRQKFDQNIKIFEAENRAAMERNQQATDHYRSILENRKLSREQVAVELEMAAAQYDDKAMAAAAQTKSEIVMANLLDKQIDAAGRMKTSADNLTLKYEQMRQKERADLLKAEMRAIGVNDPAKMQATIDAIGRGDMAPIRGKAGTAIMQEVARQYAGQDDAHPAYSEGRYIAKKIGAQTDVKTEQRAAGAFAIGPEGRQVRSLNVSIAHLGTLEELGKAIGNSDFPLINELTNKVAYEFGYPMPTTFDAAKQIVSAEVIKAVVANGGGVTERQEAARQLSSANSWAQMNDVIRAYKSLLAGQMKGLKKQYESSTHRTDFDDKLEPETIEALKNAGIAPAPSTTPPGYRPIGDPRSVADQLGITFPNYKSGDPYSTPAEAVKRGQQGAGVDWLPKGWRIEPFGPQQ